MEIMSQAIAYGLPEKNKQIIQGGTKMQTIKFSVPLRIGVSKTKTVPMNMNWYRNAHYRTSNAAKIKFSDEINIPELDVPLAACKITFVFYYGSARRQDIDNSLSVIAKFTQDSLVAAKVILDDDYTIVRQVTGIYGGLDRKNPRCEVIVEELNVS